MPGTAEELPINEGGPKGSKITPVDWGRGFLVSVFSAKRVLDSTRHQALKLL